MSRVAFAGVVSALGGGRRTASQLRLRGVCRRRSVAMAAISVVPVPLLSDNYSYLVVNEAKKVAAAVDPAEPEKVVAAAEKLGVSITQVLTTHKHWDHSGGNEALATAIPGLEIYGSSTDAVPAATKTVAHGDSIDSNGVRVEVLETPCHTQGHLCYYIPPTEAGEPGHVFTGDTLFVGGCGRFFEGSAENMHKALIQILAALPDETKVWCGHEYTAKNLAFCASIEPENKAVQDMVAWIPTVAQTIPSTIGGEKSFNVFMRVCEPSVQKAVGRIDPVEVMAELRARKDNF